MTTRSATAALEFLAAAALIAALDAVLTTVIDARASSRAILAAEQQVIATNAFVDDLASGVQSATASDGWTDHGHWRTTATRSSDSTLIISIADVRGGPPIFYALVPHAPTRSPVNAPITAR